MIQPYRTLHRYTFLLLAILIPAVLVAGLHYRHRNTHTAAPELTNFSVMSETAGYWQSQRVSVRLLHKSDEPGTWLQLVPLRAPSAPDVLIYWSVQLPEPNVLPAGARLLGPLNPATCYRLPEPSGGHLVLYSLPQSRVLDSTSLGMQP